MVLGVLLADIGTPLGFAVWVLYLAPLVLSLFLWTTALPLAIAAAASLFIGISYTTDSAGIDASVALVNRALGIVTVWGVAIVGRQFIVNKIAVKTEEWIRTGQAGLSSKMQGDQTLGRLGENVLQFLAQYLEAQAGAIFIAEPDGSFKRFGSYGASAQGSGGLESFGPGEGLCGQVVKEKRPIWIKDVPEGHLPISSGLGSSTPRALLIAPAQADSSINAVLELGFVRMLEPSDLKLLELVSESVGVAIRSARYRTRLQELLEETQRQAEELQAQSEELRVSNEELEEQSRALKESQARLESQQAELEQTNAQLEEQAQLLEQQKDSLARAQADLKQKASDLEQASRYKSEFLANMSHELRTPLNSSLILAKLLADNREKNLTAEQAKYAETIYSAGNDLLALINDILDLSKIESGRVDVRPSPVSLSQLVDALGRTFQPMAAEKKVPLALRLEPDLPARIETDPQRLEQILKNLLSNALKFTEKGEVTLEVSRSPGDRVAFAVRDTGIGIAPHQHEIIFEAFRQADGTTNRKYGGTGLGLSISRELARLLGGDIQLKSTPGSGSTFTLVLPEAYVQANPEKGRRPERKRSELLEPPPTPPQALPAEARRPAPPAAKGHALVDDRDSLSASGRTLLVIEDDESFGRILYDLSHELKFGCLLASTADEGLAMARQYLPSAIILDVGLPDHSGLSVLDRLKHDGRTRHIPVHVISADDYSQTAYSLGAIGYMLKPVKREELVAAFERLEAKFTQKMRRVLIVEDDAVQRDSVQKLLQSRDVDTVAAGSSAECLQALGQATFDCMVLDLSLPDESGFALLEKLSTQDAYSFPPVIVYTGRDLSEDDEERLRKYSKSIIIKGAKSPERLLDEVTLFLHQVEADLPPDRQRMLKEARSREAIFEGRKILIVEDDVRNVFALSSILEPKGAKVEIARNGREALEALSKTSDIDLVLMDIMMPEMDGLEAMRRIRQQPELAKLPIIALTAKAMRDDQERCLDAGANDYMAKPLDVEKLLSLIRVWMPR
jgi:signal transduction histidine kinase/DNA-binding response OmpR family regulator